MSALSTLAYLEEAERRGAIGRGLINWDDCGCTICRNRFGLRPAIFSLPDEEVDGVA